MTEEEESRGELPKYYHQLNEGGINAFKDFDNPLNFKSLDEKARKASTRNFVIDFGDDEAWCAFDLEASAVKKLLKSPRPAALNTRWINIWMPYEQEDLLTVLAKHYDFSPRLLGFMKSKPAKHVSKSQQTRASMFDRLRHRHQHAPYVKSVSDPSVDMEDYIGMQELKPVSDVDLLTQGMNQYSLANEVWHWSSVDWGRRFVCLGYNSLYQVPKPRSQALGDDDEEDEEVHPMDRDIPVGKRIWSWLLLCEDKTVITITEDPFPYRSGVSDLDSHERRAQMIIRRNLINVFRNCSKAHDSSRESPILKLPVRERVGDSEEETAHRPSDTPGLLFYCLYDDWFSSYSVVFRREHRYGAALDELRHLMLQRAELAHISRLHHIGRQLAVLKRMYQSYELIIDRVLEKHEATLASLKNSHIISGLNSGAESMASSVPQVQVAESQSLLGVSLSSAARVRFERLKYRIRLYALSEIEECLSQKDALVMMNFNLIATKQSVSVERLTRVTLLLGKVTILFMPVSLMSAYFSCQFTDAQFKASTYWMWFGIIFGISLIGLVGFSIMSGTLETSMIYKPMGRRIVDAIRGQKWRRKRDKEKKVMRRD
ncbi:hypothetical protein NA57DRAFT_60221 [Rhizodiscina lignyota]|uniref:Cora-domain-containing protein n=1 Tax=Rhizodiscina lignyota TaxID=1504668 RepID=A0A9P4I7C6_9PEZI|nr:hypothetical protein NA57DRAFT_60221 [Rhizodiscina lignyota]